MKISGLRCANVMLPEEYAEFPSFDADPARRKWNLWSYIDARDAAQAVRKSVEATLKGAEVFIIASPDTVMSRPITELVAQFFPDVPWRRELEPHESAFSTASARRRGATLEFFAAWDGSDSPGEGRSSNSPLRSDWVLALIA